jgi:uncharacterized iron-regulated membrane protein
MSTSLGAPARPATNLPTSPTRTPVFAAFWRWHFYASFVVIPVLAVLAVTGLLYLFRFQLEPALHPDLMRIPAPAAGQRMASYDDQLEIVQEALAAEGREGAAVAMMTEPLTPTTPTRFTVTLADESTRDYFVDPYAWRVLGSLDPDRTLSGTAVLLHADLMSGVPGALLMELGACWAIVMALTGYVLFVRGWRARARAGRAGRVRRLHSWVGAIAGVALLGLLVSGLPWTQLWGSTTQQLATANGTSFWSDDHGALSEPGSTLDESLPHSHANTVPWGLGKEQRPESDRSGYPGSVANLDTAVTVADRAGLARPYTVVLPDGAEGTFSVLAYAFSDPSQERTLHIDRYGGQVVSTYGYEQYSALAKTVSHGIALHEGRHFGAVNMVLSAAMCLGILFLCVTGPLLWWRRRPKGGGRLGAPRARMPLRATPVLAVAVIALGVFLPLFGISLALALLADRFLFRRVPALSRWFDVRT